MPLCATGNGTRVAGSRPMMYRSAVLQVMVLHRNFGCANRAGQPSPSIQAQVLGRARSMRCREAVKSQGGDCKWEERDFKVDRLVVGKGSISCISCQAVSKVAACGCAPRRSI